MPMPPLAICVSIYLSTVRSAQHFGTSRWAVLILRDFTRFSARNGGICTDQHCALAEKEFALALR